MFNVPDFNNTQGVGMMSGRMGIGGSPMPFSASNPVASRMAMTNTRSPTVNRMNPAMRSNLASGARPDGGMARINPEAMRQAQMRVEQQQGMGVRPGQGPGMNAVEFARMQGQGGAPPGMAARDPNDPRNAALAGYRPPQR